MAQERPGDCYIPADVAVVVSVASVGDDGVRVARDSDLSGIRGAVLVARVVAGVVGGVVGVVWGVFMGHRQTDQDEGEAGCACCAQRVLYLRVLRDDSGDSATGVGVGEHEAGRDALRVNCLLIRQLQGCLADPEQLLHHRLRVVLREAVATLPSNRHRFSQAQFCAGGSVQRAVTRTTSASPT